MHNQSIAFSLLLSSGFCVLTSVSKQRFGSRRSQVQILSSRLASRNGPSARTSKGFLFVVTRLTSLRVRFKDIEIRISRFRGIFERDHDSDAFCVQLNRSSATPRFCSDGSFSCVSECSTDSTSRFSSAVLSRKTDSSIAPARNASSSSSCV